MIRLAHGRIRLALHQRHERAGPALLLLHQLYGASSEWPAAVASWPGSVYALDFSGHGHSDWLRGGAYQIEWLLADADAALAHIGPLCIAGRGLGAYVALLLAGARPERVAAALLLPGAGLGGGGAWPDFSDPPGRLRALESAPLLPGTCDPGVRQLDRDIRPVDYTERFARAARRLLLAGDPDPVPRWWEQALALPQAERVLDELATALMRLARYGAGASSSTSPPRAADS